MQYKTDSILAIVIGLSLSILAPTAFVFFIDPFQIYHASFFKKAKYSTNQNYQHAGWINRLLANPENNYQAIVVGSSTMANYTQTLINNHLPWGNTMNLSINGGSPWMQHTTARYALEKNPHLKHILWDVMPTYAFGIDEINKNAAELSYPFYLYNNSLLDDAPYLFNKTNIETGLKFLSGDFSDFSAGVEDNGPFYATLVTEDRFNLNNSIENRKKKLLPQLVDVERKIPDKSIFLSHPFPALNVYMLDTLMPFCNTPMDINITFSANSRFYYASVEDVNYLYNQIWMRRYVVERTHACKNIKVYAFDNLDWIVSDLHNYADNFHYDLKINHYILESITNNENRLTTENIDQYEALFIRNINDYKKVFLMALEKP